MGKKCSYFLIARNKKTNEFQVVPVSSSFQNSLEEIDLYTTSFLNRFDMMQGLHDEGILEEGVYDFYIVHEGKVDGMRVLHTQEVLFHDSRQIQEIAKNSLKKQLENSESKIDSILNEFCYKMQIYPSFYDMVLFGKTNIYSKFINYFSNKRFMKSYDVKYKDGGWAKKSYPLLRDIVESFSRYSKSHTFSTSSFDFEPFMFREVLSSKILEKIDKSYNPDQFSFFDFVPEKTSISDSTLEVINMLEKIDYDSSSLKLLSNLNRNLSINVLVFLLHKSHIQEDKMYEKLVLEDKKEIVRLLNQDSSLLESLASFCMLYTNNKKGGENERGYQKQYKN